MKKTLLAGLILVLMCSFAYGAEAKGQRGWLGVTVTQAAGEDDATDGGVKILSFLSGSSALAAGIEKGDVIVSVNGKQVQTTSELIERLQSTRPGDRVQLTVQRAGEERFFEVELGDRAKMLTLDLEGLEHLDALGEKLRDHRNFTWTTQETTKGFLGVKIQDLTTELKRYFGSQDGRGLLVSGIIENTPAENAGLEAGDVILEINGESVTSAGDLQKQLHGMKKGDEARLVILRHERELDVTLLVDEKKTRNVLCHTEEKE